MDGSVRLLASAKPKTSRLGLGTAVEISREGAATCVEVEANAGVTPGAATTRLIVTAMAEARWRDPGNDMTWVVGSRHCRDLLRGESTRTEIRRLEPLQMLSITVVALGPFM